MCCGMCFHVYEVRLLGWMKVESVAIAVDFDEICHVYCNVYTRKNLNLEIIHSIPLRTIGLRELSFLA